MTLDPVVCRSVSIVNLDLLELPRLEDVIIAVLDTREPMEPIEPVELIRLEHRLFAGLEFVLDDVPPVLLDRTFKFDLSLDPLSENFAKICGIASNVS